MLPGCSTARCEPQEVPTRQRSVLMKLAIKAAFPLQRFPVDQRNGDGEAKCPAGRARVCPTVLHPPEPGSRLPAQVGSASVPFSRFRVFI